MKGKKMHNEFNCECHETCSWCCDSVLFSSLREVSGGDGALLCRACRIEYRQNKATGQNGGYGFDIGTYLD